MVANATSMCILSPVLLIILGTMTEDHMFHISESLSASLGCVFLFGMIAAAVFMFITYGMREAHMEDLEKDSFETEYGVSGMVREKRDTYEPTFIRNIAIGVVLCILSVIPLIIVGVNLLIRTGMIKGSYDTLLQEGEFTKEQKQLKKKTDTFSGVYWCLTTAIYLGWSFWSREWDFTWIIWPVAGVLFAALLGIVKMIIAKKE